MCQSVFGTAPSNVELAFHERGKVDENLLQILHIALHRQTAQSAKLRRAEAELR